MDGLEPRDMARHKLDRGYESQGELMDDLFAWLDLRIYAFYKHHRWLGPGNELKNMLGLVVSREEFEHQLAKSAQRGLPAMLDPEDAAMLESSQAAVSARLEKTRESFPLLRLFRSCCPGSFERGCAALAYAAVLDRKYEKLLGYLQDDVTKKSPSTALAAQLFLPAGCRVEEYAARFSRRDPFTDLFDWGRLEKGCLELRRPVLEFLSTGTVSACPGLQVFDGAVERPEDPLAAGWDLARRLDVIYEQPGPWAVLLRGGPGMGKRFQVEHLMVRRGARCVFADLETEEAAERAREGALIARLSGAALCCRGLDRTDGEGRPVPPPEQLVRNILELDQERLFLLSRLPIRAQSRRLAVELELPQATEGERAVLFRTFLGNREPEGTSAEELAAKFHLSPRQIKGACRQALGLARLDGKGVSGGLVHQCCRRQTAHKLGDLARPVPPAFTWEDVVMPRTQRLLLRQACGHVRFRHKVYHDWGFERKISYGRGLSILFAGAPGTGKTMCAQVIANELNMEMYKLNISQVVSKYIGETEKNLQTIFTEARRSNCILFFDECDALFGKRSEVKDAHDRNANMEVAYLLQQLEEYDGVCILATNLMGNIDAAFMRRITYVVRFPFPDAAMRESIYRRTIPREAPVEKDVDWAFLAEKFELSGGHIKNIVLSAAFLAALEGKSISMGHLLRAAVEELRKNGIVVVRENLREYADLLEEFWEKEPG